MHLLDRLKGMRVVRTGTEGIDKQLLVATLALLAMGLIAVFSATITKGGAMTGLEFLTKQAFHAVLGVTLGVVLWLYVPMRILRNWALALALLSILSLALVHLPFLGVSNDKGVARWITLGFFNFQPVELTKIMVLVYVCSYCVDRRTNLGTLKGFFKPLAVVGLADFLLLLQPDFGSAFIITMLAFAVLFLSGARLSYFLQFAGVCAAAVVAVAFAAPYRVQRLLSFFDPFKDPQGSGYQQVHSLMAFGKGGWFGSGLGQSVEKWSHLPEAHTDFIVSVIAEETGLVGFVAVLGVYAWILFRAHRIAGEAQSKGMLFEALLAQSIGLLLFVQMFINIGSNLSLLPVKGLTLPLLSYGGSSLVAWLLTFALLQALAYDCGLRLASPPRQYARA